MSKQGFLEIKKVELPLSCAMEAIDWLYQAGIRHVEGIALFVGVREKEIFYIKETIIPKQYSRNIEGGLLYVVDGGELERIGLELYDKKVQLFGQIHSHPDLAYHSDTDDAFPIVTVLGGISIVVPYFARDGVNLSKWAIYRLLPLTGWTEVNSEEKKFFIDIIDDLPEKRRGPN